MPCATGDACDQGKVFLHTWKHHPIACSGLAPMCRSTTGSQRHQLIPHLPTLHIPQFSVSPGKGHPQATKKTHSWLVLKEPFLRRASMWAQITTKTEPFGITTNRSSLLRRMRGKVGSEREKGSEGCREHPLISPAATPPLPKRG